MDGNIKNMKTIETFIFVHDQEIILDFINKNRFSNIDGFKYVFLGSRDTSKIQNLDNIIIVRNLPINIEQYPKLTSFTGWYALCKNNLITSDYVNLFEYDINTVDNIINEIQNFTLKDPDFIGYFPMSVTDPVYVNISQYSKPLIDFWIEKNIDILKMIQNLPNGSIWSSSSNSTWKKNHLFSFVEWFNQSLDHVIQSEYCGHIHERSISFYYFLNSLNVLMTNGYMQHVQMNSHGTSPLSKERSEQVYKLLK